MSWYYSENNDRRGPVEDADFQNLVQAGTIRPTTLVWREGYADWVPYSSVAPAAVSLPPALAATLAEGSTAPVGGPGFGAVSCSQCGRLFPADDLVTYEGRHVCAACKPLFFQKIKEGALVAGGREYGGFWIRFCAKFVDNFIVRIATMAIIVSTSAALPNNKSATGAAMLCSLLLGAAYSIFCVGKFGATPGKMACKLRIVRSDGSPVSYGRATGRFFAEILSAFLVFIGYIMVCFDPEKRALHDRICDTRVIRQRER